MYFFSLHVETISMALTHLIISPVEFKLKYSFSLVGAVPCRQYAFSLTCNVTGVKELLRYSLSSTKSNLLG